MTILFNDLRELADHVAALGTEGCQADPITADLLWSIAGRLRYRANQLQAERDLKVLRQQLDEENTKPPKPRKLGVGSALRDKIWEIDSKLEDDTAPARRKSKVPDDLSSLLAQDE